MPGTLDTVDFSGFLPQAFLDELAIPLPSCISPVPLHQTCTPSAQFTASSPGVVEPVYPAGLVDGPVSAAQPDNDGDAAAALDAALHAAIAAIQGPVALPQHTSTSAEVSGAARSHLPEVERSMREHRPSNSQWEPSRAVPGCEHEADLWSNSSSSSEGGSNFAVACNADVQDASPTKSADDSRSTDNGRGNTLTSEEEAKRADRRRRNREASSRSYYRRKRQTEALTKDLRDSRAKAAKLFKVESALRRENMRLKRLQWERLITTRLDMTLDLLPGQLITDSVGGHEL